MADSATRREFFAVKTVAETLEGFRPERRTPAEAIALDAAAGRVPAEPVRAPHDLPGFSRSTVDGYAVRAADTFGATELAPKCVRLRPESLDAGTAATIALQPSEAAAIATGGMVPRGADAILMVEHADVQLEKPGFSEAAGLLMVRRAV